MSTPPTVTRPATLPQIAAGFSRGLAQAVTGGASQRPYPPVRSAAEALKSDWIKLGGDMRQAVGRLKPNG